MLVLQPEDFIIGVDAERMHELAQKAHIVRLRHENCNVGNDRNRMQVRQEIDRAIDAFRLRRAIRQQRKPQRRNHDHRRGIQNELRRVPERQPEKGIAKNSLVIGKAHIALLAHQIPFEEADIAALQDGVNRKYRIQNRKRQQEASGDDIAANRPLFQCTARQRARRQRLHPDSSLVESTALSSLIRSHF